MNLRNFIILTILLYSLGINAEPNKSLPENDDGPWVVNVYYENVKQLQRFAKVKEPWQINSKERYFIVDVENIYQYQELFSYGFNVEINQKQMDLKKQNNRRIKNELNSKSDTKSIPGYSCLRTVEETFATIDSLIASYPNLASNIKVGETWEKQNAGGQSSGYDLRVIKITNSTIPGPKPILYVTSSMHARELAPAELNTRFAEYLLQNYGTDADATWIVDHREVHLLLQANPDGRKRAESANTNKRKNQNNTYCSNQNSRGVDMNRNFSWMWNEGSGSSGFECDSTFRGVNHSPEDPIEMEPETDAIDIHLKTLFADARGPNLNDAAPDDTTGVYIDIHSEASLVMWPYGFDSPGSIPLAPNHNQLRSLGRKLGWYNNYYPQASNQLYGADGASDDNAYGQLGVASYTFELGGDDQIFRPTCSYVDNTIVPDNLQALIYAAKVAKTPYITASGPDIENLSLDLNEVQAGDSINISGIANDLHFNNSNGTESTQNISKVEAYIDELPSNSRGAPLLLSASDGSFNSSSEAFSGSVDTTGLNQGQHIIYVVSTDTNNVTGVPYAVFFDIVDPATLGTLTGITRDSSTNQVIASVNLSVDSQNLISDNQGVYSASISAGTYNITANKQGYTTTTINNVIVSQMQTTNQDIYLQPICASIDESVNGFLSISDAENSGWTHGANQGSDDWTINSNGGVSNSRAFSSEDVGSTSDKYLVSPLISVTADSALEFWHKYNFEAQYDGSILEISIDNGANWIDLGSSITVGGYDTMLNGGFNQPLGAVSAWNGEQNIFTKVEVDLSSFDGQDAKIRWRLGTDSSQNGGLWLIDDIKVLDPLACINTDVIFKYGFE